MAEGYHSPTISDLRQQTPRERWQTEIDYAEKEREKFIERGRTVTKRFVDERDMMDSMSKWFNLFYANSNILTSALYAQPPKPTVARKYTDYQDQIARVAALILERAIEPDLDDPRDTFNATMQHAVFDRVVPGAGCAWLRLETDVEELDVPQVPYVAPNLPNQGFPTQVAPDAVQDQQQHEKYTSITDQRVCVDYVYWEDFLWSPCRTWEERRWVARRVMMSKEELVKRFGEDKAANIPLNHQAAGGPNSAFAQSIHPKHMAVKQACVYEIWDRVERNVIWFCKDCDFLLDEKEDFLNLVGFEPCPRPMLANVTSSSLMPRPDFYMVQDQYNELDTVNNRISMLVRACKVAGVYDRASDGVQRLLQEGTDNILVPVDNWAAFAEKGGVKGQVDWLPLEQIVNALQRLYEAREGIKQQIYEITGIADIVRGASKASETLGAQEIKAKFASVRIKSLQDEVARFAADISRIKAEMMVKHFDPYILQCKSNVDRTDDADLVQPALELLQSEEGFEWRVTVTSDQMVQTDYQLEKQDRIELLTSISQYLAQASQMFQAIPQSGPLLVSMLKWAVSGFRGAKEIEGLLDRELDAMLKQPPEQKPDPAAQKAEAEMKKMEAEMGMKQEDHQLSQQAKIFDIQAKRAMNQQEMQHKERMGALEMGLKEREAGFDMQARALEVQGDIEQANVQNMLEMRAGEQKLRQEAVAGAQKMRLNAAAGEQKIRQGEQSGRQKLKQDAVAHQQKVRQSRQEAKSRRDAGSKR